MLRSNQDLALFLIGKICVVGPGTLKMGPLRALGPWAHGEGPFGPFKGPWPMGPVGRVPFWPFKGPGSNGNLILS